MRSLLFFRNDKETSEQKKSGLLFSELLRVETRVG